MVESEPPPTQPVFSAADIGALAHLYRGEVYRSTVWRTRLDPMLRSDRDAYRVALSKASQALIEASKVLLKVRKDWRIAFPHMVEKEMEDLMRDDGPGEE